MNNIAWSFGQSIKYIELEYTRSKQRKYGYDFEEPTIACHRYLFYISCKYFLNATG